MAKRRELPEEDRDPRYADVSTVEPQRNDLVPEEFPEGPYGMSLVTETLGKSTPWREGQRQHNPFGYENREFHEGIPRDYPPDYEPGDGIDNK